MESIIKKVMGELRIVMERRALHALKNRGPIAVEKKYDHYGIGNGIYSIEFAYNTGDSEWVEYEPDMEEVRFYDENGFHGGVNVTSDCKILW